MVSLLEYFMILYLGIIWLPIAFTFKCITWDVSKDEMYFTFRTGDFSESVTFRDNDGNVKTICSFEKQYYHCYPMPTSLMINLNIKKNEIIFIIKDFRSMDMDGIWSVSQEGNTFSTNVSLSNGFSQSTDIHMTGEIKNSLVTVKCFACRAPHGYNVEFLINGKSEDSLTLNYETGKCTHQQRVCNPEICSCSTFGNEFFRSFYLQYPNKTTNFSCNMIFEDRPTSTWFSKNAMVIYNGTDLHFKQTVRDMENPYEDNNQKGDTKKDNIEKDFKGPLIGIGLSVTCMMIVVVVTVVYKKSMAKNNTKIQFEGTKTDSMSSMEEVEQPSIDYSDSKQMPRLPVVPFDVVFLNFDVDIERQWVERAVDMIKEKNDKIVCGLIGRDFLFGLQIDKSFHFIEEHTTVVVTFSEKSSKMHSAIRNIETIKKLVVVMVEECSAPFFCINMKCVDATLDKRKWFKQLLKAIDYQTEVKT